MCFVVLLVFSAILPENDRGAEQAGGGGLEVLHPRYTDVLVKQFERAFSVNAVVCVASALFQRCSRGRPSKNHCTECPNE
jgi:hypothetical protein